MKEVLQRGRACRAPATARAARPTRRWRSPARSGSRWSPSRRRAPGAQATYRLDDADALRGWLAAVPPRAGRTRRCWRSSSSARSTRSTACTIGGDTVWASISDYRPPPLEVLRNPWIQWTVLLPRDIAGPAYAGIHESGPAALQALGVRDALTHMEWFRRPDGSVAVSEVGARPPGAQLDLDARLRARLRLLPRVGRAGDPRPVRRRRSGGTPPARPTCAGRAAAGCAPCTASTSCSSRSGTWSSRRGCRSRASRRASDYEGEGYVIVRDPDTAVVEDALHRIVSGVRVELVEALVRPMNVVMLSPGYPAEMAYFTRALAARRRPGHRRRRPAAARAARARPATRSPTTSTCRSPTRARCSAALRGLARHVADRPGGVPVGAVHDPGGADPRGVRPARA